ncbi:MAG: hypothetical protein R2860_00130 [Desulfobacterales bacterium]
MLYALTALPPMLHNVITRGKSWQRYGITRSRQVMAKNSPMKEGSESLWEYISGLLDAAAEEGVIADG